MATELNITKTKAKKSLIISFKKEDKSLLKQVKKKLEKATLAKTNSDDKQMLKYLLEFGDAKAAKQAKVLLEGEFKEGLKIEYPFSQIKKKAVAAKKHENKENQTENAAKPFEIKLPKLILRNISFKRFQQKMNEESLRKEMEKYGKVVLVNIPLKEDGKMKGFGFVQFSKLDEAKKALEELNSSKKKLFGNKVIVDWCVPKNIFQRLEAKKEEAATAAAASEENGENEKDDDDSEPESSEEAPAKKTKLDDNERRFKAKAKSGSQDVMQKRTVFLRNLSFDATQEAIAEAFSRFGPVKYVKICMDRELERPKGTGFVQFETSEAAEKACAESNILELDFRTIQISMAVSRDQASEVVENRKNEENTPKDKRNLALAKEGVIYPNSYEAEGVSKADMQKRLKIEASNAQKLKLLHFFVSPTRLSVHNIPIKCSDQQLREIFERAAVGETSGKKSSCIRECRIMRDLTRVNSEGVAKSKGYGFVEFATHELAKKALHATNNNPDLFEGSNSRLIVQFSIEDMRALKKKEQRFEKGQKNVKK